LVHNRDSGKGLEIRCSLEKYISFISAKNFLSTFRHFKWKSWYNIPLDGEKGTMPALVVNLTQEKISHDSSRKMVSELWIRGEHVKQKSKEISFDYNK
jgi:hypothetical protein